MKKILLFKKGIYEKILSDGLNCFTDKEISQLVEALNEVKIDKIQLKNLIDLGIHKKNALIMSCCYELGKREAMK